MRRVWDVGGERRLTGSWIRALKCTRALRCLSPGLRGTGCSFNVRFQNKRTDLGSSAARQWWMASSCDLSVFTTRRSKKNDRPSSDGRERGGSPRGAEWLLEQNGAIRQSQTESSLHPACPVISGSPFDMSKSLVLANLKFPNSRLLHFCTPVFSTTKHSRRPIFKDSKKHSQLSTWDLHRVLFS